MRVVESPLSKKCVFNLLTSLVAIYLGIKKRPSPGPSDVAGIWEAVCGGTLRRWFWPCGRRHSDVAARSAMPAPFYSPAPMARQGAAWLSRPRCATFPRAPPRLLTGCATRVSGGRRLLFGMLQPKSPRTLNSELRGVFVYECLLLCEWVLDVCAQREVGVEIIEEKNSREGTRGWTREKRLLLLSLSWIPPLQTHTHTHTHTHRHRFTHTWPVKSHKLMY